MNTLAPYFPALVDMAVKATILLGLAWTAGLLLKNCSAALRHAVRACALCAALLLPFLSYLLPAWHWQGLPRFPLTENQSAITTPAALPGVPQSDTSGGGLTSPQGRASAATRPANDPPAPSAISQSRIALNGPRILIRIWLLGTLLVALRLLVSRSRFARLVSKAVPVKDAGWTSQIQEIARLLGIRRAVALLESQDTEVPLTTGAFRPKVVLSPDYAEWSSLRRYAILHHELAHIRRLDTLAQALSHAALAMYWFHPLVWLTVKVMRAEREQACDDYVLAAGTKPSQYAHELLEIASSLRQPEFITALALARRSQLEGRVMALLNPAQRRGSISQKTSWTLAALTLCVVLPLAAIQTAAPQKKSSDQRTTGNSRQTPGAPSAATDVQQSDLPQPQPEAAQPQSPAPWVAPPAPAADLPPVGGVAGGVPGGIVGGVRGGVLGGVRPVPAMPPVPAPPPSAPAAPQIPTPPPAPPAAAPRHLPALPKTPRAVPEPQTAPEPRAIPSPHVAPVPEIAPLAPVKPSTPTAGILSPSPQAIPALRAASTASPWSALQAQLLAIHVQAEVQPHEIEALRAKIAAISTTASSANAALISKLRAQTAVLAAQTASTAGQAAALRAQPATLPDQLPHKQRQDQ